MYGRLINLLERARLLDASAEVASLRPLVDWLTEAAMQLREGARVLRQDETDGPVYDPNASPHPRLPGDQESGGGENGGEGEEAWDFEVNNTFFADQFIELASKEELSEEVRDYVWDAS